MIQIENLVKYYGDGESKTKVLKGIDCTVEKGQICVLLGPSGSGKSTLLNLVGGIEEADSGKLIIDGEDICQKSLAALSEYRRERLGFVFQFYNLVPNLTVRENIEVGQYLSKKPLDMDDLIKTLGLSDHVRKFPNQLSGGQQQRCSLGRALVKNPDILLCDEPTGALDYKTSKEILSLIETVNGKFGTTIILVTHNEAIKDMAHKVVRLRDGQIRSASVNDTRVLAADLEW